MDERQSSFNVNGDDNLLLTVRLEGKSRLLNLPLNSPNHRSFLEYPCSHIEDQAIHPITGRIATLGSDYKHSSKIYLHKTITDQQPSALSPFANYEEHQKSGKVQALSWRGVKGRVHGFFYRPDYPVRANPPLIVLLHNGISNQVFDTWPSKAHYYNNLGYAVLYVNFLGSTGYGPDSRILSRGTFGELEGDDVVRGVTHLRAMGLVNERVAIWGGGTGGYAALQAVIRYPTFFKGAISVFAPLDMAWYRQNTSLEIAAQLDVAIGPWPDARKTYEHRSPLAYANRIKTPLALFYNDDDSGISKTQIETFQRHVCRAGSACDLSIFKGRGGTFESDEDYRAYQKKVDAFLAKHLLADVAF